MNFQISTQHLRKAGVGVNRRLNALLGCTLVLAPAFGRAEELPSIEKVVAQLEQRVTRFEADAAKAAPAPATVRSALPAGVILYGKIDLFAEYDSGGSAGTRVALDSGGLNGTRWGIKGGTDLRNGLRGIFQLEGGLFANNGQASQGGRLFGRQAYAGVEGQFGRLTAGRQFSPMYNTVISFDPYRQGYGSPSNDGNVSTGPTRYDNSLVYATPTINGFGICTMVALGGATGERKGAQTISASYANGPLSLGAVFQHDDHIAIVTAVRRSAFLGTAYRFGNTKVMGGIGRVQNTPDAGSGFTRREWMIGTKSQMTPNGELLLAYGAAHTDRPGEGARVMSAGWIHALVPEARVYAIVSRHLNGIKSSLVPMGTMSSSSYTVKPGDSATGMALGFQYDF